MNKKKATPKSSPKKLDIHNNNINAQQSRMLKALSKADSKGITTVQARDDFNVMHPAGRVRELRSLGYVIATVWTTSEDGFGRKHRMARYVLLSQARVAA